MRSYLPGKNELVLLLVMALCCAGITYLLPAKDVGLFFLAFPLFVASGLMGLWKRGGFGSSDE